MQSITPSRLIFKNAAQSSGCSSATGFSPNDPVAPAFAALLTRMSMTPLVAIAAWI